MDKYENINGSEPSYYADCIKYLLVIEALALWKLYPLNNLLVIPKMNLSKPQINVNTLVEKFAQLSDFALFSELSKIHLVLIKLSPLLCNSCINFKLLRRALRI